MEPGSAYRRGFLPYALAAFLIGLVGGFSTVLGPAFVQDVGLAYQSTTWTALAQAIASAACAPILGRLGDSIGRRRTLLLGMAVFTLGNLFSALAQSLLHMLAARFLVGLGTAAMTPVILAYIVTRFPPERVSSGFSTYMLISSASVILGPSLGAALVAAAGWRAMVWLCTGLCIAVLALCLLCGREHSAPNRAALRHFDGAGAILVLIFFSMLLCIPAMGQNLGWNTRPFLIIVSIAALSLPGLVAVEARAMQPILPAAFIRRPAFVLSVLILLLTQGLMQANMTNTIVFVNYTHADNPALSGYSISVLYLGMSLGAILLGPLADRFEPKRVLSVSLLLTGAGCALLLLFSAATPLLLMMASLGMLGLGLGGNGTILMKTALSGLPAEAAGNATGTYGLFRDLAAPFGVAVLVPFFTNRISLLSGQQDAVAAATAAMHQLAGIELLCVAAGLLATLFLPKIHNRERST